MRLGENIYQLRKAKNMSQDDLAAALEVSRQSVSKWENDSAVPELEKLMRMAQVFDVSLDALVGMQQPEQQQPPAPKEEAEPRIIYLEKPVFPSFSGIQLLGFALLIGALLLAIVLYKDLFGATETFLFALPLVLCGILCLVAKHALFLCGWVSAGAYWLYLFLLFPRWEHQYLLLILGVLIVAAMVACSIHVHTKGILRIPTGVWILGALVLAALAVLLVMNTLPPIHITGDSITAIPE